MTLIELMISMLILTLVCVAWLEIIGIQSAKKEARRREAVERLAGMMDAFMFVNRNIKATKLSGNYHVDIDGCHLEMSGKKTLNFAEDVRTDDVHPVFKRKSDGSFSPEGYQLRVVARKDLPDVGLNADKDKWGNTCRWLVGRLYDHHGTEADAGKPFYALTVCLGY